MGFPDTFALPANRNTAYKQLGNAVCPPVIAAIGGEICRIMRGEEKDRSGT